jgi:hypothetical protein
MISVHYCAAMAQCGGRCLIEAGVVGRIVDREPHPRRERRHGDHGELGVSACDRLAVERTGAEVPDALLDARLRRLASYSAAVAAAVLAAAN